jgi:cytochrome c2
MKAAFVMVTVCLAVNAGAIALAASAPAAQNAAPAQTEKGRTTVTQVCVGCHVGINRMLEVRKKSPDEWKDTIYRMIGRGAQLYPDEIEPLAAYLAGNAGRGRAPTATGTAPNQGGLAEEATAILDRRCRQCHDVERARTKPATGDWNSTLDRMATLGAALTAAERQTLIEYLNGRER